MLMVWNLPIFKIPLSLLSFLYQKLNQNTHLFCFHLLSRDFTVHFSKILFSLLLLLRLLLLAVWSLPLKTLFCTQSQQPFLSGVIKMCEIWHCKVNSEAPIKLFQGKSYKVCCFKRFGCVLALILFLGIAFCGDCNELAMVSVPLGFEISGLDRSRTWVSQNGVFAFGYLDTSSGGGDVDGYAVGVRYNLGDKAANIPVWTVGGGLRVSENSTIRLNMDGRMILFENPSGLIVWSSDTSGLGVQKATLLNSGNLVLMGVGDNVLWQSFNSPTNGLLPGQSLHFPQNLRAPSTKSITSYYSLVIGSRFGELALVWELTVTYWTAQARLSSYDGRVKEARFDSNGVLGLFNAGNRTVWSVSSKDFEDHSQVLRHLRIDSDGNLRIYSWDKVVRQWKVGWQAVENQCNVFGSCGLYSLCGYNSSGPICSCLYGESLNKGNDFSAVGSGSSGCRKMVDLGNCKMNASIKVLKQTVLYGVYPPLDVDLMLSEEACKEYCSNDSTCIAITSKNDGSGVCSVKRTGFISGYRNPSVPATSYLKVCQVPQAVSARVHSYAISIPLSPKGYSEHRDDSQNFVEAIGLIVLLTVSGFLSVEMFVFWFVYRRRQIKAQTRIPFRKDVQMNPHHSGLIRLSYEEVVELTANFANQLGPTVYKGVLPNKMPVIAKVLDEAVPEKDFRKAVSTLGAMHHRNLASVRSFCFEPNHIILLYEYVPNGSLGKWLFKVDHEHSEGNWQQRLDIALGVARALAYLHTECPTCVAHGSLKLENVLLAENLVPKVTDFGIKSLLGNEATSSSESLPERDIYMFGEMLLQIVTCKRDIMGSNLHNLVSNMDEELKLEGIMESERIERAVRIALWCLQNQPFLRPSIGEVVKVLEGTLSVDRPPSTFAFRQEDQVNENLDRDFEVDP